MLKLCGFAVSNYYNKVKLTLLEKQVPFEEVLVWADQKTPELMQKSPAGKVPYLETEQGILFESQVIVDYIEAAYPQHPLVPADAFEAAKVRSLVQFIELHLELVARDLYAEAFFGKTVSNEVKEKAEKILTRNGKALAELVKFQPYIAGSEFTMADCAAIVHLPLVAMASKNVFGKDVLADLPIREYGKAMAERPTVQRVNADRKANTELMKQRNAA